jgi:hypothetical protein
MTSTCIRVSRGEIKLSKVELRSNDCATPRNARTGCRCERPPIGPLALAGLRYTEREQTLTLTKATLHACKTMPALRSFT